MLPDIAGVPVRPRVQSSMGIIAQLGSRTPGRRLHELGSLAGPAPMIGRSGRELGKWLWAWLDLNLGPRPYQGSPPGLIPQHRTCHLGERCTARDRCEPLGSDGRWTNLDQAERARSFAVSPADLR